MTNDSGMSCCGSIKYTSALEEGKYRYRVQLGQFRLYNKAMDLQLYLMERGIMSDIDRQGELFSVNAGDFDKLDEAVLLEKYFRKFGYDAMVIAV